jgi:hypothetical protein
MITSFLGLLTATTALALFTGSATAFAQEASTKKDLSTYLCKDVMRLSGSDRETSLALVHGYRLGKMGTTQFDIEVLSDLTDRYLDYCLDNPNANALSVFEMLGK